MLTTKYVIMQNAPGVTFIMKEMVKHLVNLLFVNALFILLVRKRTKSGAEYNIKLIGQPTNYFIFSAAVIGISSARVRIGRLSDRRIFLVQYENEAFHLFVVVLRP